MNKILNPFEYLSNQKAIGWGAAGTVFALALVLVTRDGALDGDISSILRLFSTNLMQWLPLSLLLYGAAVIFSPSRIRAVDIFAMNLFALLPMIVLYGIVNAIMAWLGNVAVDPLSLAGLMTRALYYLLIIILSISMVWSMVWGCFAYSVSANVKGLRGVAVFVTCFVLVNVMVSLLVEYL